MAWRIGVDSGGTFTDICLFEEASGRVEVWKVASTPHDPSHAIGEGAREGLGRVGASSDTVSYFGHGTTVATNALIQHKGVPTGLITTDGFRDLLEIGRQKRPDLYDLEVDKPPVVVARDLRFQVPERILHDGQVETTLDEQAVRDTARALKGAGVKAVAICFLYSFVKPDHEARARRILGEEFPEAFTCASHEIAPEFREFERMSTAVVNAYLGPVIQGYIRRLADRLAALGLRVPPHLTQSNGGVIGFDAAARMPVRTVLSGPSTGVVAAQVLGRVAGFPDLIIFDMGGTSTDVALLQNGEPRLTGESIVHGYPIKAPMLDIHTVGAGGGSIAFVDFGGLLKVGCVAPGPIPVRSATTAETRSPPSRMRMSCSARCTRRICSAGACRSGATCRCWRWSGWRSGLAWTPWRRRRGSSASSPRTWKAIRVISVQRGHDPRDYTLVAFGGAGPLHAARLAKELEIRRVLVPRNPGILCAMGLLLTDLRADFATTRLTPLGKEALAPMDQAFKALEAQAVAWFDEEGIAPDARHLNRTVDMRYAGQNYELPVPVPPGRLDAGTLAALGEGFAAAHRQMYGFVAEEEPVQLITFRIEATGPVRKAAFRARPIGGPDPASALDGRREVWLPEASGFVAVPIYQRDRLLPGNSIVGPAIVEQMDATTVVLSGQTARVDAYDNLILEAA
jgi:N-methylhydantoinase A